MSYLIVPKRFAQQQPQQGPKINYGCPITRGIVFCAIPSGNSMVNVLTGSTGVLSGTTLPVPTTATSGRAIKFTGSVDPAASFINFGSSVATSELSDAAIPGIGSTWFFWAKPTGGGGLAERSDGNTVGAGWTLGIGSTAGNPLGITIEYSATNGFVTSLINTNLGVYNSFAVTWNKAQATPPLLYVGGKNGGFATQSNGSGAASSDSIRSLVIGRARFDSSNANYAGTFGGNIELVAIFKRILSAAEILSLHNNRYQLLQMPDRRLYSFVGSSALVRPQVFVSM